MNASPTQKVVMLVNAGHNPFDPRIFLKEASALSEHGYQVSIIIPTSRDETINGIQIISVTPYRGWRKLVICPWLVFRKALQQPKASILHLHDSELLVIGIWLKLLGYTVIYDAHEDTPLQISYQHWLPPLLKKPYAWLYMFLEKLAGWTFDGIIVAEPVILKYFPQKKTCLIRNFPIVGNFARNYVPYANRERRLVHFGMLTKVRGVVKMAAAVAIAQKTSIFEFQIGGPFSPKELQDEVMKFPVTYLGWIPPQEIVERTLNARAGIVIPQPVERYKTNYPVKLFEYMAAGVPIIATRFGEVASFVREAQCGILVDPENENEIAAAIAHIFEHEDEARAMGERGKVMVTEKYSWEEEAKSLLTFYRNLALERKK